MQVPLPGVGEPSPTQVRAPAVLSAAAVFLGAFLLFQIQPLIAKAILPWFGGAASVWTASMLFFQVALLSGYLYAHLLIRRIGFPQVARLHLSLLVLSLFLLPVLPDRRWRPYGDEEPVTRILLLLASTVGLQYLLLASTSPLLQALWVRGSGKAVPLRWYALSNAASLLGLLTYPVLIEPFLGTRLQSSIWSALYGIYALLIAGLLLLQPGQVAETRSMPERPAARISIQAVWLLLPAVASVYLLAATSYISENLMPVPLIWVLPLAAYLLSFILPFAAPHWRGIAWRAPCAAAALLAAAGLVHYPSLNLHVAPSVTVVVLSVFLVALYCHSQVTARAPAPEELTRFYLLLATGGAVGGFIVTVIAPLVLPVNIDFALAAVLAALTIVLLEWRRGRARRLLPISTLLVVSYVAVLYAGALSSGTLALARNFYGSLRVTERTEGSNPAIRVRYLTHGAIVHGAQSFNPAFRRLPLLYYGSGAGVQLALEQTRKPGQRVGVIGLGTGSLAAFGRPGDIYRFYEINPRVVQIATAAFTYLTDTPAHVEVAVGDARLVMEREQPQNYDLLVLDAFSSDTVPAHLLTREAMSVYLRHLQPKGMLAFHVSNRVLRLTPVVAALAASHNLSALAVETTEDLTVFRRQSNWVLLSRDPAHFQSPAGLASVGAKPRLRPEVPVWTDDYNSIWKIIR